jgi:hypothetical protein
MCARARRITGGNLEVGLGQKEGRRDKKEQGGRKSRVPFFFGVAALLAEFFI